MAGDLKFMVHEALTHEPIGQLDPKAYGFNDPVWGGGSLEMTLTIPTSKGVQSLKDRTRPDEVELFVLQDDTFLWGGPINFRSRRPGSKELTVKAQHWKSWFYTRLVPDKWFREVDEFDMIFELWDFALDDYGTPQMIRGTGTSGKIRQFTVDPFWSVGKALDSFGQRDGGFEWSLGFRSGSQTGLPEIFLELWEPGAARGLNSLLFLDVGESQNKIAVGEIPEDATEKRPRVWSTGEGGWPAQPFTKDEDPALKDGGILLREEMINSNATEMDTLFDQARAERLKRNNPLSILPVDHPHTRPNVKDYRSGDRARLRIRDEWTDMDLRGVRIVDRAISKKPGSSTIATVQLDLADVREDAV